MGRFLSGMPAEDDCCAKCLTPSLCESDFGICQAIGFVVLAALWCRGCNDNVFAVVDGVHGSNCAGAYKRLHGNQKADVDDAVLAIVADPTLGEAKVGDLAGVFVYKFLCVKQTYLLAYEYDPETRVLLLVGSHENFCRTLKT